MSNDDILCEAPGPGGRVCTLPYGHQPENIHAFHLQLPHDLSEVLEGIMMQADEARERFEKAYRRQRIMFWTWCGMLTFYLGLVIWKMFE